MYDNYKYFITIIELIAFILIISILFFLIKNYRKEKLFIPFIFFIIACYLVFNLKGVEGIAKEKIGAIQIKRIYEFINSYYTSAELYTFYFFLIKINRIEIAKKIAKPLIIVFTILTLIYVYLLIGNKFEISEITPPSIALNIFEYSILLFLCLCSYYALAQKPITSVPINIYNLWTLNSLFLYISISLPIIIISNKIIQTSQLYSIMYIVHYITINILLTTFLISVKNKSF